MAVGRWEEESMDSCTLSVPKKWLPTPLGSEICTVLQLFYKLLVFTS